MAIIRALAALLLSSLLASAQANPPAHPRWALHWYSGKGDFWIDHPSCHPLQHFLAEPKSFDYGDDLFGKQPAIISDSVESQPIGAVKGFAIYDVVHKIDEGELFMKMILVERRAGEFCEIFQQDFSPGEVVVKPPYILDADSEPILATQDSVTGTGGSVIEDYWTFDKDGPIPLNLSIIAQTTRNLLPDGLSINKGYFNIGTLLYEVDISKKDDANCCPSGGRITIKFTLKDHQLVVISQEHTPSMK